MQPISYYIVVPTVAALLTFMFRRFKGRRSAVRGIRGPPSPSFLLGLFDFALSFNCVSNTR